MKGKWGIGHMDQLQLNIACMVWFIEYIIQGY